MWFVRDSALTGTVFILCYMHCINILPLLPTNQPTKFWAIFYFKTGTATSMFNNSPALYRNTRSTCVQIVGDLSVWMQKLWFSEVRKHVPVVQLKSLYSPISPIKVNFDKIQFEGYCIYRPNSFFLWWKYKLFTSKRFLVFSILLLDIYLCYEENENTGKRYILCNIWNIAKDKAPIVKRGNRFWKKPCMHHYQKEKKMK